MPEEESVTICIGGGGGAIAGVDPPPPEAPAFLFPGAMFCRCLMASGESWLLRQSLARRRFFSGGGGAESDLLVLLERLPFFSASDLDSSPAFVLAAAVGTFFPSASFL